MPCIKIEIDEETRKLLEDLAKRLGVSLNDIVRIIAENLGDYKYDIEDWANQLKVKKEHKADSVFNELFYYGIASYKNMVNRVLDVLKAKGRYELEYLELDPSTGTLEIELVALEGSDLLSDRLRISWSPSSVIVESYYYLEEDEEPPLQRLGKGYDWSYLPDEHAIVVSVTGKTLKDIPPIYKLDEYSGLT